MKEKNNVIDLQTWQKLKWGGHVNPEILTEHREKWGA